MRRKIVLNTDSKLEWQLNPNGFGRGGTGNRFAINTSNFHSLRLYARGEQPVQKYKDELAINGDLSYLNLDWKPVPVISKFVDIVSNGITEKEFEIKAYAQDPGSTKKRTDYAEKMLQDIIMKDQLAKIKSKPVLMRLIQLAPMNCLTRRKN